ncbi:hypothetical protein K435DRAFT_666793, partial [Dendrothele bispora CBS 962.96]
ARYDTATTNLQNHVASCEKRVAPPEHAITTYATGGAYNKGALRFWLGMQCVKRQRPFEMARDPELHEQYKVLNPNVNLKDVKSPQTISSDIKEFRALSISEVKNSLAKYDGFFHLSFDGWTAPNVLSFLGIDVNYCDDEGHLVGYTLDFTP